MKSYSARILKRAIRRSRRLGLLAGTLLLCALVMSCAGVRAIDPSAGRIELAEDEGILLVSLKTDVPLESVETTAGAVAGKVPKGEHLLFLVATAGSYRWSRLDRKVGQWEYRYFFGHGEDRFHFRVVAGEINYPGSLVIRKRAPLYAEGYVIDDDITLWPTVINRSTTVLEELAARNAPILERFPMRYSGWGRDEFIQRYLEARQRLSTQRGGQDAAP